jgi:putative restriction endonuclease
MARWSIGWSTSATSNTASDSGRNGLALCVLHHKTFDLGAFTVAEGVVLVSDQVHGTSGFHEALMAHHVGIIREPQRPEWGPEPRHLAWHRREVFKGDPGHGSR